MGRRQAGSWLLGIFGLVFAFLAIAFGVGFVYSPLHDAWRSRGWQPVEATLEPAPGIRGRTDIGYRYRYGGTEHLGRQISFYDRVSGSGVNTFHRANYRRLLAQYQAGRPITVWVDPRNPADAVFERAILWDSVWGALGGAGFMAVVGLLFAYLGFFGMRPRFASDTEARAFARERVLRGSSNDFPTFVWLAALFWNGMVALMLATGLTPARGVSPWMVYAAAGAFVLVGVFIAWKALLATLRWSRYRGAVLTLNPHPAVAGGDCGGSLLLPLPYTHETAFKAELVATEYGQLGGRLQKNSSYTRIVFQHAGIAHAQPASDGTRVRFKFELPQNAPASQGYGESLSWTPATAARVFIQWTLRISADVPGVDVDEQFEIPVAAAPAGAVAAAHAVAPARSAEPALAPLPPEKGDNPTFQYRREGEHLRIVQPAWKKPGRLGSPLQALAGIVPCAVFSVVGVILLREHEWIIGTIFFLVGTVFILAILGYLAHELSAEVDPAGITIVRRIGPVIFKQTRLAKTQIAAVEAVAESSQSSPGGASLLRSVRARAKNGELHTLSELIPTEREAVALRNLIVARLALGSAAATGTASVAEPLAATPSPGAVAQKKGGLGWVMGVVVVAGIFAYQAYPFIKVFFSSDRSRTAPPAQAAVTPPSRPAVTPGAEQPQDPVAAAIQLGDRFWDQRNYAEAYVHYERGYYGAQALPMNDAGRDLQIANASAGLMATACTLGKWDVSERAMAELKARIGKLPPSAQSRLKYWIDTGEPRLKARQC